MRCVTHMAVVVSLLPRLAVAQTLEVRFCGQHSLHAYSLSAEGALHGLLLQQMTVINRSPRPVEVTSIELDLLRDGQAVDTRRLARSEIAAFGEQGQRIEAGGGKASIALLCGDALVPTEVTLAGPGLTTRQGLLIARQAFAFGGRRDSLRVRVTAKSEAGEVATSVALPIDVGLSKTRYRLPLRGVWVVKSGPSFHTHHRWALPSEFGLDFVKVGPDGRSHRNDGTRFEDYYAYGEDVLAAADGRVVKALNDQPQPTDLLLRPNESFAQLGQRTTGYQQAMFNAGVDRIAGNHIVIDHGNGEYALYAHLQPGSVRVHAGDRVKAGDPIAKIGGSGNALVEPHLHFHLCDRPVPLQCVGLPIDFRDVEVPMVSFAPRPLQSGDIVIAR
jgi:murein DD-endopeptidase MepM/ murein hydrolase activator NlpD